MSYDNIKKGFEEIYKKVKSNPDISEEKLKRYFHTSRILENLGYREDDIHVEVSIKRKRTDIHCSDEYGNVVFVIEFKKPAVVNLKEHFSQLWDDYVKPLKADYGALTNGYEFLLFKRINSNYERILKANLSEITIADFKELSKLSKPRYEVTKIDEVLKYLNKFDDPSERINLTTEESREHFFENFKLEKGSVFSKLVIRMMELFDSKRGKSKFLDSAYDFWEKSYAKEPESTPRDWERIMKDASIEINKKNLFKFMFCLETTYALFTRLILAKACEDYKFPSIEFSNFIKTEIKHTSFEGAIPQAGWAVLVYMLIENMRSNLIESIFEEDIFYWWVDDFRDLKGRELFSEGKISRPMIVFGDALAKLLMTLYKFDFSEIIGDPLGTLYQKYFDKKTRKALGEFYTPKEVVHYIIDAVGYRGRGIMGKRLLDPACGSGTFLVEALKNYLNAAETEAKDKGWCNTLKRLCKEYHIVGFDIHPFATIMAQIQFMLVLIPYYKRAMDEDHSFILKRIPIFRTDSLIDESKTERMTLKTYEESGNNNSVSMNIQLPVREKKGDFAKFELIMPYYKEVFRQTDLLNNEDYFSALQAMFDVIKENAKKEKYSVERENLENKFKEYLEDKNWSKLSLFFEPYSNHLLSEIKRLKEDFGDGRMVKSIEDVILASLLKNYVKYDFVVGNPPYVRKERIPLKYKTEVLKSTYPKTYHGDNDICVYFLHKGIDWLEEDGHFGYIVSGKFTKTRYGKYIRAWIPKNLHIDQIIDLRGSKVFSGVTVDPLIFTAEKDHKTKISVVKIKNDPEGKDTQEKLKKILEISKKHVGEEYSDEFIQSFSIDQKEILKSIKKDNGKNWMDSWRIIPSEVNLIFEKIYFSQYPELKEFFDISTGIETGLNEAFIINEKHKNQLEKNLIKPLLRGSEIKEWYAKSKNKEYIIYTHELDEEKLRDNLNVKNHLKKFKNRLDDRKKVLCIGKKWFELAKSLKPEILDSEKILAQRISQKHIFSYDDSGYYPLHTCIVLSPKKREDKRLEYFLGLLNSRVLEFIVKITCRYLGRHGYEYEPQYLKQLPIIIPKTKAQKKLASRITRKVDSILSSVKLEQKIENFPEGYTQNYRSSGTEFTKISHRFNSAHKQISTKLEKTLDSGYSIRIGKEEPIFVDAEEKARYLQIALNGRKFKKGDKFEILVPRANNVVKEILKDYAQDNEKLDDGRVEKLEEEINNLVYELYGLNKKDQKIINKFLEKF